MYEHADKCFLFYALKIAAWKLCQNVMLKKIGNSWKLVCSWNSPELAEASFVWSEVTVFLNRLSMGEFLGLIPNGFDGGERVRDRFFSSVHTPEMGWISPEVTTPSIFCLFARGETSAISKGEYSAKKKSRFFKLFLHVSKSQLFLGLQPRISKKKILDL